MADLIECWVCGKEHEYCPTCGQTHGWKFVACTPEHYQIHMTIENYLHGGLTKEQAGETFAKMSNVHAEDDLSWMLPSVEKCVRKIIGEKPKDKIIKTTKKSKLFKDE